MLLNIVQQVFRGMVNNLFWFIKNAGETLNEFESEGLLASSLSILFLYSLYSIPSYSNQRIDNQIN